VKKKEFNVTLTILLETEKNCYLAKGVGLELDKGNRKVV